MSGQFHRYLRAKRSVDDRSLDWRLVERLRDGLADRAADRDGPLRVLDIGAGLGTMLERFIEWEILPPGRVEYTAVDADEATARAIPDHLSAWAAESGVVASVGESDVELAGSERRVAVEPVAATASSFVAGTDREWDLLVGAAVLDLVPLDRLPTLLSALPPGGYWYFPITFDGGTRFLPDHPADDAVERYYHRHMDEKPGGDSRAGSHALDRLLSIDAARVDGTAGSDWIVSPVDGDGPGDAPYADDEGFPSEGAYSNGDEGFPSEGAYPDGDAAVGNGKHEYPGDEAYFLWYILDTIETALGEIERGADLDDEAFGDWLSTRRDQLRAGELTYVTHQLDLLGRRLRE